MSNDERVAEQDRVNRVVKEIDQKAEALIEKSKGFKESVIDLRKTFWDDVTVNLDEPDDVIETQASIKQQAELLIQQETVHGKIDQQLKTLKRLKDSPYFGRIDFRENGEENAEKIYIGIASLMDQQEENFLIYDWRAPISSLYYDYPPGEAMYETVGGKITGEISLKRQFIIRQSNIMGMFDTGVTIGDEMLQQALGNNASTTMKNIVATIQQEQNKIIRNERSHILFVQGVAGSGKTSAALQRIAYLMYRYRDTLHPENVVLFSPNPLFSSYISNVLPELGEANVRQNTFLDYLKEKVGTSLTIESPFEQLEYVLTNEEADPIRMENMNYKSSLAFKQLVDAYIDTLQEDGMRFKNVVFRKQVLISGEEIHDYFYQLDRSIPIFNKLEMVAKWIIRKLRQFQKKEKDKDWVMAEVELLDKEDYAKAYQETQTVEDGEYTDLEEDILRKWVVQKYVSRLIKRIKRFEFVHIVATYHDMFTRWEPTLETPTNWGGITEITTKHLKDRFLTWEDAAPFAYFQDRIMGDNEDRSVRHLFIDEVQDYSEFQFAYIRYLFPYTRMTLLGDVNQAIYTYATKENPLNRDRLQQNHERITLSKSYRSTKQIVNFTKYFAPGNEEIIPFNREGNKPRIIQTDHHTIEPLLERIHNLQEKGNETIAIITKTLQESKEIYNRIKEKIAIHIIDEETYAFHKGVLVLPVYLAKGIEFDTVIIPDASNGHYAKEADRSLFYTACTRAMHELVLLTSDQPTFFIQEAPDNTYEML
ncbi:RNA polymerase recycling motor HelD [Oceanobacillus halotolerans]|uniref:RNA polymerase recycling motor HelD n=1 Tax=Oceanobacillus halotolerans TaxID=2663380 RepID=UPI0013D8EDF9|nr:RNA polymerase recycling motor HelD [Oceanobacillus halotolerans]